MRPRTSIRGCVRPSVHRLVGPSPVLLFGLSKLWASLGKSGQLWVSLDNWTHLLVNSWPCSFSFFLFFLLLFFFLWIIATLSNFGQLLDASIGQLLALLSLYKSPKTAYFQRKSLSVMKISVKKSKMCTWMHLLYPRGTCLPSTESNTTKTKTNTTRPRVDQ